MRISFGAAVREPMPGTSGLPASTLSDILLRRLNTLSIRTQRSSARIGAATIVAALLASLFAFIAPADAAQVVTVTRTSGPDRYATAAAVALADFPVAERPVANVILASGENYPDGLAASSLAGAANAPVLLTQTNSLPAVTASALASLQPTTVHIVGGTAAVSAGVRAQLTGLGYTLNEIGGPTRYETAALISQFMRTTVAPVGTFGGQRTAIIATGLNWPDALAGGAPAAAGNHPILLTGNTLHPATSAELTAASIQRVIILGGTAAVPASVADAIQGMGIAVTRVSGPTRYETATALANILMTPAPAGFSFSTTGVFLVSGTNFPDALTAGPWAGRSEQAILLAGGQATLDFLTARSATIATIRVVGGTLAVSEAQASAAQQAATSATPTVQVAAFAGASGLRLTFSERVTGTGTVQVTGQAAVNCVAPAAVAPCVLNAAGTEMIVTLPAAVAPGSVVTVSGFATPAPNSRSIGATTFTVGNDAAGTATISAVQGGTTYRVTFSRSVNPATATGARLTTTRGATTLDAVGGTWVNAPFNTVFDVDPNAAHVPLAAGDIVRVLAGITTTGGAAIAPTQVTVAADLLPPVLNAAVLTSTGSVQAFLNTTAAVDTNVFIRADQAGVEGNAISVEFVQGAGVSLPTTAALTLVAGNPRITVTLGTNAAGAPNANPQTVAAAINGNVAAAALVTATGTGSTVIGAFGPANLANGSRVANVTLVFNERIQQPWTAVGPPVALAAGVSIGLDLNGNGFADVPAPTLVSTGLPGTDLTAGQVTFTFVLGAGQTATAGTSQVRVAGIRDVANNVMTPTARTLVALP
jgi:putative cell wall-binding protein